MTNIKSNVSDVNLNYSAKRNYSFGSNIIADVSDETVTNTTKMEAESVDLGFTTDVDEYISYDDMDILFENPEQLKEEIASTEILINELQEEVNKIPTYSEYSYHELVDAGLVSARDEANAKRDELNTFITELTYLKKEYEKKLNFIKYNEIEETDEYTKFVDEYQINYQNIDFQLFSECGYNIEQYLMKKYGADYKNYNIDSLAIAEAYVEANKNNEKFDINRYVTEFTGLDIKVGDEMVNAFDFYYYSTKEQQDMYHYLVSTEGLESANEYLALILDDIYKNKGYAMACDYTSTLILDEENIAANLIDLLSVNARGLEDGISTFVEGIEQVLKNDGTMSAEDYERMFVLQYLKDNTTLLDKYYTFNNSLGNMVPSMLASTAISIVATPTAGSIVASTLMGLSAAGNSKHQALIDGAKPLAANLYAIANGSSEALLGYFLGKIPGISKESELSIRALLDEGVEEFSQEWVDAGLRAAFLGEDIDLSQVSGDSAKSFIMGVAMAGLLNGGKQMISMSINGKMVEINVKEILKYVEEHPETSLADILGIEYPGYFSDINASLTESDLKYIEEAKKTLAAKIEEYKMSGLTRNEVIQMLAYDAYNSNNISDFKNSGRAAMEYLIENGMPKIEAALEIRKIYKKVYDSIGYSELNYNGNVKVSYLNTYDSNVGVNIENTMNMFSKIPPELQQVVDEVIFYDNFDPNDFYFQIEYNNPNHTGCAGGKDGKIKIYLSSNNTDSGIFHKLTHEASHIYDVDFAKKWGISSGRISESQLWQNAMDADKKISGKKSVTKYGESSPVEDFAETIATYFSNPSALDKFPNRKALIEKYFNVNNTSNNYIQNQVQNNTSNNQQQNQTQNNISLNRIQGQVRYDPVTISNIQNQLTQAYAITKNKYGEQEANLRLQRYLETGNKNYITTEGRKYLLYDTKVYQEYSKSIGGFNNMNSIINQQQNQVHNNTQNNTSNNYTQNQIQNNTSNNYTQNQTQNNTSLNQIQGQVRYNPYTIENLNGQLMQAYTITKNKYGEEIAMQNLQKFLETGNKNYITTEGRKYLLYDTKVYQEYSKSIGGFNNIKQIIKN